MKLYDLLVIGGGSGGVACSRRAASFGKKVVLFEPKRLGGTCVNVGCVPKKVMYNAADVSNTLKAAKDYGFSFQNKNFDFPHLKRKRDAYIERLNAIYYKKLTELKVDIVPQKARFVSNNVIEANGVQYSAPTILIAAGGEPNTLNIPGAENMLNSDDFFNRVDKLPHKVAIIGGGYIGLELAGVLNALGVDTTLICRRKKVLFGFDQMVREGIMTEMEQDGVKFNMQTNIKAVKRSEDLSNLHTVKGEVLEGFGMVLMAIGRHPVSEAMTIKNTDIKIDEKGSIITNEWDETSVKGIYAVGDINGKVQLTPVAVAAGRAIADRLYDGKVDKKMDYELIPSVVFSHPPIGSIGLTEKAAVEKFGQSSVKVYTSNFVNMFYSVSTRKPRTKYKLVCLLPDEKVIGLHLMGTASDEILQGFAVAMKMGATKADFDRCVAIHPTASEELVTMI